MNENIKAINPIITIQPLASATANRDAAGTPNVLALLSDGSIVRGFVINRDARGNPVLRTPQGDFTVGSEVFIKTGSEVTLRVDSSQSSHARILTIDNLSPEEYSAQTTRGLTKDTVAQPSLSGALAPATQGTNTTSTAATHPVLQAIVLQANARLAPPPTTAPPAGAPPASAARPTATPQPTAALPPALAALAQGNVVSLTVLDVKLPPLPVSLSSIPEAPSLANLLAPPPSPPTAPSAPQPPLPQPGQATTTPASTNIAAPPAPAAAAPPGPTVAGTIPPTAAAPPTTPATAPPTTPAPSAYLNALPPTLVAAQQSPRPASTRGTAAASYPTSASHFSSTAPIAPATQPAAPSTATPSSLTPNALLAATANTVTLPATVIGHGEDGANILHTEFATLKLFTAQPLPSGTTLTVKAELVAASATQQPIATFSDIPAPPLPAAISFPELSTVLSQWAALNPGMFRAMTAELPVIGPKFTSGLLYFISAIKHGSLRDTFSNRALNLLSTEQPELLTKLTKDIGTLHQHFTDPPNSEWKGMTLPFIFGSELTPAHLYIRHEGGGGSDASEANKLGQRFLLDIAFSELGPMQFDGFVRYEPKLKSLELFVRSQTPLEGAVCDDIRGIFETATGTTGLTGHLVFQHGEERFVKPQAKPASVSHVAGAHTILA